MPSLTWTCHVCGEERPDEKISVYSRDHVRNGVPIRENVRYCNDRPECAEGAKNFSFVPDAAIVIDDPVVGIDREADEWEFRYRAKRGLDIPRVLWRRMADWRRRGPTDGTK